MKAKRTGKNPYATVGGGRIEAPHTPREEPKATRRTGTDLRTTKK